MPGSPGARGRRRARRGRTPTASPPAGGARCGPCRTRGRTVRQGIPPGGSTGRAGRAQRSRGPYADRREARHRGRASGRPVPQHHARHHRVPRSDRQGARRDPACASKAERHLPGRQEPAHADRRRAGGEPGHRRRSSGARRPIAFGTGDEALVAKTVLEAVRPYKLVKVTGGVVGGKSLDLDGVTRLATLPSRDVLLAQLGGAFAAPATQVAGLLAANLREPRVCAHPAAGAEGAGRGLAHPTPIRNLARPPRATIARSHESHGHPYPGRAARPDRRHDARRGRRLHQEVRSEVRRHRRRPGRRRSRPDRRRRPVEAVEEQTEFTAILAEIGPTRSP